MPRDNKLFKYSFFLLLALPLSITFAAPLAPPAMNQDITSPPPAAITTTTQSSVVSQSSTVNSSQAIPPPPLGNPTQQVVIPSTTTASADVTQPPLGKVVPKPVPMDMRAVSKSKANIAAFKQWLVQCKTRRVTHKTIKSKIISQNGEPVIPAPLTFKQSQQTMLNAAPPSPPPSDESVAAFNNMMQQNMPLSPGQVVKLRQMIDLSQRAAAVPPNIPPRPVSSTLMVNLAPGTTPPAIRLSQGYVSSLVFVDSLGAPWPIASFEIGDPKSMTIQWDGKGNIIFIQAISPYNDSNLVVRLVGLPTPITLELVSGQRVVDFRADIHVSGLGPNSKDLPLGTHLPRSANQVLLDVLDGIAPAGSRILSVSGGDAQAWVLGNKLYLRTRFTVLSPGWIGTMVSPDGMNAYEMMKTSSVLISQYGDPVELKIEGL